MEFHNVNIKKYPNLFTSKYLQFINKSVAPDVVKIVHNAFKSQDSSNFVRLPTRLPNWTEECLGLRSLIPTVLTLSLAGYSFIIPDIIGGSYVRASEELYIRWLQACCFLPTMLFAIPPWDYSPAVTELTRKFINLHTRYSKIFLELAQSRIETGEPIIRPLWFVAPDDRKCYGIKDQFMLGNDILVAPILEHDTRERIVYLPEGKWIDQNGNCHTGPTKVKVDAPLEELPYFKRE